MRYLVKDLLDKENQKDLTFDDIQRAVLAGGQVVRIQDAVWGSETDAAVSGARHNFLCEGTGCRTGCCRHTLRCAGIPRPP